MKNKYWISILIFLIMMILSILFLILNNFFIYKVGLFNIHLWLTLVTYLIGLSFFFIANLKYAELETNNPIKSIKFSYDYYDKVGYALFTSGIVTIFASSNIGSSIGLIVLGITFIIISQVKKETVEKFYTDTKKRNF